MEPDLGEIFVFNPGPSQKKKKKKFFKAFAQWQRAYPLAIQLSPLWGSSESEKDTFPVVLRFALL